MRLSRFAFNEAKVITQDVRLNRRVIKIWHHKVPKGLYRREKTQTDVNFDLS